METKLRRNGAEASSSWTVRHSVDGTVSSGKIGGHRSWDDTFIGVGLPRYRDLIKRNLQATTGASWSYNKYVERLQASMQRYDPFGSPKQTYTSFWQGAILSRPLVSANSSDGSQADSQARVAFLNKVRDVQTTFQGGTFFGELREAIHGIRHPLQGIRQGLNAYADLAYRRARRIARGRRIVAGGAFTNRAKVLRDISKGLQETWLEFAYDKRPLVNDVHDFAETISSLCDRDEFQMVRGTGHHTSSASTQSVASEGPDFVRLIGKVKIVKEETVRYLGLVSMENRAVIKTIPERFGLTWSEFAPTIYNLIPYSFLFDYFSNVGNLIDAASVKDFRIRWGCRTMRIVAKELLGSFDHDVAFEDSNSSKNIRNRTASVLTYTNECVSGTRSIFDSVGVSYSDVALKIPGGDSLKWLNIGALFSLKTLYGRNKPPLI